MTFKRKQKWSIFGAVFIGALMASQSASALSCAQPNLQRVIEEAKASEKIYYVLAGRFSPQTKNTRRGGYDPRLNGGSFQESKEITRVSFEGYSIAPSRAGDQELVRFPVDIETSCAGPWCSGVPDSDRELLAFVEARDGEAPILRVGPCSKFVYPANPPNIETVRDCLTGTCSPFPGR